jgi:hypothetical protein
LPVHWRIRVVDHEDDVRPAAVEALHGFVVPALGRELVVPRHARHGAEASVRVGAGKNSVEAVQPAPSLLHGKVKHRVGDAGVRRFLGFEHRDDVVALERKAGGAIGRHERPHAGVLARLIDMHRGGVRVGVARLGDCLAESLRALLSASQLDHVGERHVDRLVGVARADPGPIFGLDRRADFLL